MRIKRYSSGLSCCNKVPVRYVTVVSLTSITHSAVGLSVPLEEEAGAVPDDHPLQMGRHVEPGKNNTMG